MPGNVAEMGNYMASIFLHIWKQEWLSSESKLSACLFYLWRKYDVTVT